MMVLFIYKLLCGLISRNKLLSLISFNTPARNIRISVLFAMPYSRVNVYKYSVTYKSVHTANEFLLIHCTFDLFFQSISKS